MHKAVIVDQVHPCVKELLAPHMQVDEKIFVSQAELVGFIGDYDILVMRQDPKVNATVLNAATRLKAIACHCAGTNHIDRETAEKKNITILNSPGKNANAVAELTISKMLDLSRSTMAANEDVKKNGVWNKYKWYGSELRGKTIGIVGFGKVGQRVAELAHAFGMTVLAYDPYVSQDTAGPLGVTMLTLDELLRTADYIPIHVPLTPETKNMISTPQLAIMKDTAVLLNMARGGLVDEEAVCQALAEKRLGGYAVDVMTAEQAAGGIPKEGGFTHPLFAFDNFIATPHIAGLTAEADDAIGHDIVDKVLAFLKH